MSDELAKRPAAAEIVVATGLADALGEFQRKAQAVIDAYDNDGTRKGYTLELGTWLGWCATAGVDPNHATLPQATAFREWAKTRPTRYNRPARGNTVARTLRALSAIYETLVELGGAPHNPFAARVLKRPSTSPVAPASFVEQDDYDLMIAWARAAAETAKRARTTALPLRDVALLEVLWWSGLRIAEALQLTVEGLDVDGDVVRVNVRKKGGDMKDAYLAAPVMDAIRDWRVAAGITSGLIFPGLGQRGAHRILTRVAKGAGVKARIHPHGFRATAVTTAISEVGVAEAQGLADHKSITTTMRYDRKERGAAAAASLIAARTKKEG